jgi:hypothetical protein
MLLIAIIVWLGSAVGCYSIAQSKGLDGTLWTVLGLLLGPIAVLFVAIATPGSRAPARSDIRPEKKCYNCAEMVKLEANTCRFCGAEFDPEDTDERIRQQLEQDEEDEFIRTERKRRDDSISNYLAIAAVVLVVILVGAFLALS